jgi:hypothetical protein
LLACLCGRPDQQYFEASLDLLTPENYLVKVPEL